MAEFTCIVCPNSCLIEVKEQNGELIITGQGCKRGEVFAADEYRDPKRMLTTTVRITDCQIKRLPVISSAEIPKADIRKCLQELYQISIKAPVQCGDIIYKNIADTGIDIIASRTVSKNN